MSRNVEVLEAFLLRISDSKFLASFTSSILHFCASYQFNYMFDSLHEHRGIMFRIGQPHREDK